MPRHNLGYHLLDVEDDQGHTLPSALIVVDGWNMPAAPAPSDQPTPVYRVYKYAQGHDSVEVSASIGAEDHAKIVQVLREIYRQ